MKILDQTHDQFVDAFRRNHGGGTHTGTAVYRQVMKHGQTAFDGLDAVARRPGLAGELASGLALSPGRLVHRVSDGGVVKFVTRLADDLDIESVVIPMFRRYTLCVSSQVGCRMGCRFCRTGKMGLLRNLTAAEIVGQVFTARHQLGVDVRNVVFMGMGEPLDNPDNLIQALRVLVDQRGMDIARRYITVSTVGLTAGIDRLARFDGGPVNLAVSLNAPNDDIRSRLMPVNRAISMSALRDTLQAYPLAKKSALFVEYVLIRGVNDRKEDATALARYLAPMKVKLNLIPCNPAPGSDLQPPSVAAYERFHDWLVAEGVFVRRRGEKGGRIMAACGQLGGRGGFRNG
ncbi:dual-specificity RNA methyltransferase RlmN [Desulfosarcina alkanivorans]|uniref:Dual-specificity RNA methyltransferase RlmN n=1 Tax=Desulfosarcina alkanivorans TaxID=571177 RepID=A0A5K7YNY3_9BACT|nr:23S rRNA (adenine(2503)-C(2))-methyltransferase RlmN [Desulfosarcina alkanivorans]BBO70103.1 dual-specificity RNA methyltransferase RlmN [Desulfosarcina alkanivorans]